jgi:hypothetical protein
VTTTIIGADYVTLIMPSGDTTGVTDQQAIQAAIASASGQGGGTVDLAGGLFYSTKITLPTGVKLRGSGRNATILQLANGVNDNLIETTSFSTLTNSDTTSTPYGFGVEAMTLDGNKANQTGTSNCLAIYGYGYRLNEVTMRNARNFGLWTEWGSASNFLGPDGMESFVTEVKLHDNDGGTIRYCGPHDTQFINVIAVQNSGSATAAVSIPVDGRGNGGLFVGLHVYGAAYSYGVDLVSSGLTFVACQIEGASIAQVWCRASINLFEGCKLFWGSASANTAKGMILGDASHTNINSVRVHAKVENCSGGALDLTYAGGGNFYDVSAVCISPFTVPSPAVIGSFNASDTVTFTQINNAGAATSDSVVQVPQAAKATTLAIGGVSIPSNVDQDPLGFGFATTHPWAAEANNTVAFFAANAALYQQLIGYGMSTNQLRLYVGTSSGNISAGLYNNGGQAGSSRLPNARQATTGAIACPAAGMATVTLTTTVTVGRSWYGAISVDNTTATFLRSAPTSTVTNGVAANQGSAHPLPATAGAANGGGTVPWMATV